MNIRTNESLIRRNARIGQITMLAGLVVLVGGFFLSLRSEELLALSWAALLLGFILSQIGIYFSNRWGRVPRPHELLDSALKGLDSKYTLYHYESPVPHLLVGPSGVWVLMPRHQRGEIYYEKGRWRHRGGNLYMKIFMQDSLGRPELEISDDKEKVHALLSKHLPEEEVPEIQAALVLTDPNVEINIPDEEQPPAETVHIKKLKDLIRKAAKDENYRISQPQVEEIQAAVEES